ncbi:MAG: Ig-like domain-containing protein [Candidatus Zixiibacteriota bacterium]|nr:MAG: Ig-like domain-containing protein [candidate division Zixibacteria bacterium]
MRPKTILTIMAFLLFAIPGITYGDVIVRAESPDAVGGVIGGGTDFTIDLWMDHTDPSEMVCGSYSFKLYSPDQSISDIIHLDYGSFNKPMGVEVTDSFSFYFNFNVLGIENGWDGALPDSINFTLMGYFGLPGSLPDMRGIRLHLRVDELGTLCIDSCTNDADPDWDWLFMSRYEPVTFSGPYCWTFELPNPTVVSTSPEANEVDVPVSTIITATFDVDMDETTINASTFLVSGSSSGTKNGMITYDNPTRTASFQPLSDFDENEVVTVELTTGVASALGMPLAESYIWSFTTEYTPTYDDELYIPSMNSCLEARVPVMFNCATPTAGMTIPLKWDDDRLILESVSFEGTGVENWDVTGAYIYPDTQIVLLGMLAVEAEALTDDWNGPIAFLNFKGEIRDEFGACLYDSTFTEETFVVHFDTALMGVEGNELLFGDISQPPVGFVPITSFGAISIQKYRPGEISINFDCNRNLLDILALIQNLYSDGADPWPFEAGDVTADCFVNLLDLLAFIDFVYQSGDRLQCGCVADSIPPRRLLADYGGYSGTVSSVITEGKTAIKVNTSRAIDGIEMTLRSLDGSPVKLVNRTDAFQLHYYQEGDEIRLGMFDLEGMHSLAAGENTILEADGKVEIVSVLAGDAASEPVYLEIAGDMVTDLVPVSLILDQNRPNPFNPITEIGFILPYDSDVRLEVYNLVGQKISTLVEGRLKAGNHTVLWDGSNSASGIYFYRIKACESVATRKMILLK